MAKVINGNRLVKKLTTLKKKYPQRLARGVRKAAEFILEKSQEIVPVDTGELKESGHIEAKGKEALIVYDAEHAVIVHEDLEAQHAPPTQAKYLEQPLREYREEIKDIIEQEVRG